MGINVNGLRFLLYAKSAGVDFFQTAMIGRQGLHLRFDQFCSVIRQEFNHDVDLKTLEAIYNENYCEDLLRYLGANVVHSYDFSGYEGSTHVHDFNLPLPRDCHEQYTAIIEGGTLEHVFNFPMAIKNCMQMLRMGGHYLGISPTNNYMGHGFYQFSPELYFRVFSAENGFETVHILLHEGPETKKWYKVPDPEDIKGRVGILNSKPALLLILAKRLFNQEIFSKPPLQSDYVSTWDEVDSGTKGIPSKTGPSSIQYSIPSSIPRIAKKRIIRMLGWKRSKVGSLFRIFNPFESTRI